MQRRHDLDWVRVLAFGVLVLYHVGMYYVSWGWHVKSPHSGPAIEPFMFLSSPWRLGLLFLISGAATSFLLRRHPRGFLASRSARLLIPLLFGMFVVVVPQAYYEVVEKLPGGYHDGYWAFYARYLAADPGFCRGEECLAVPTWNHLWFLAYLWTYTLVLWLGVLLLPATWRAWLQTRLEGLLSGPGLILWPAGALALARLLLVGHFESTHALVDDWYNHAQYLPLFLLGYAMARIDPVWPALWRMRWIALALAAVSYLAIVAYFQFAGFDDTNPPPQALRLLMRVVWALNQWCAIAAILGFAWRFREADGPVLRYLVPAVFPIYVLHQTIIVIVAHHLKPAALSPLLEGPLLIVVTVGLCFAAYEIIRRVAPLRPLFGLPWRQRRNVPTTRAGGPTPAGVGGPRP